jgi:hypothetical protein
MSAANTGGRVHGLDSVAEWNSAAEQISVVNQATRRLRERPR